jgi:cardiolipin synthase
MYILENDPLGMLISDILIDKSRQGVEVRIIIDDVGCWNVPSRFIEHLREEGIEVRTFLPVHFITFASKVNYRNHRKMIVIDGKVGYIGGMNIALRYIKGTATMPWRDTMVRITGSVVCSLQRAFLIDWYFVDRTLITNRIYYPPFTLQHKSLTSHLSPLTSNNCLAQVVTSSPATLYPEIMQGFVRAITSARRYIYLETPYFLPNEPVLFALKTATMAGVDVRIICPHHSDAKFTEWASRSYLRELHEAGAQIFLYEPGFMHSKLMVIDDSLVTCGSTNADFRSFENNFEANVFIYSQGTALRLKKVFLDDQSLSVPLESVTSWMQPKFLPRLWESLTRMISPLL